tara:strand:+ start:363 stop:515 length:153 start_codon:yes stop_codon:yes gene_type:complete
MEYKEQERNMQDKDFNKDQHLNDYKFLLQKLKNIKETIHFLEIKTFKKKT